MKPETVVENNLVLTKKSNDALQLAMNSHAKQLRKETHIPYISHVRKT
jgi:hypothetical protein